MPKFKWIDRITNEAVLDRIKEERGLWYSIKVRRDKTIRNLLRLYSLTKSIIVSEVISEEKTEDGVHETNYD